MRLLLDTHVLVWWLEEASLVPSVHAAIRDADNQIYVSAVSPWEIAIKKKLGKMTAPDDLPTQLAAHRFTPLPITVDHALAAGALPLHHKDPFDRILVAQARLESLTLVTHDLDFAPYGIALLAA